MTIQFTPEQLAELQTLRNTYPEPTLGNSLDYALLYDKVLSFIDADLLLGDEQLKTILWIEGARTVNRDIGPQSHFIRGYNKAQAFARYSNSGDKIVTDAEAVTASMAVTVMISLSAVRV